MEKKAFNLAEIAGKLQARVGKGVQTAGRGLRDYGALMSGSKLQKADNAVTHAGISNNFTRYNADAYNRHNEAANAHLQRSSQRVDRVSALRAAALDATNSARINTGLGVGLGATGLGVNAMRDKQASAEYRAGVDSVYARYGIKVAQGAIDAATGSTITGHVLGGLGGAYVGAPTGAVAGAATGGIAGTAAGLIGALLSKGRIKPGMGARAGALAGAGLGATTGGVGGTVYGAYRGGQIGGMLQRQSR
jgi:hypothetical protein